MRNKLICFGIWVAVMASVYAVPLSKLVRSSLEQGYSSHIILIPLISIYLVWNDRSKVFTRTTGARSLGSVFGAVAAIFACLSLASASSAPWSPTFLVLSAILFFLAGFAFIFGNESFRQCTFSASLLVFMLPVPNFIIGWIIHFLQSGSAYLSELLFALLGVPVLRNGFLLTVPGVTIEVAEECSGINSSIALLIIGLLFAHESLRSNWRRGILIMLIVPFSLLKNAIRIVTLTLLATKVDPGFLTGRLHHEGGFVFFLITLALGYPVWKLLRSSEIHSSKMVGAQVSAENIPVSELR